MRWTVLMAGAALLAACGADEGTETLEIDTPPSAEAPETLPVIEAEMLTGTHCYFSQTETETEGLTVTFDANGTATGRHFGTIHDEASAYFAAFDVTLTEGEVGEADTVSFDAVIEVDGDTQFETSDWVITEASANMVGVEEALLPTECDGLMDRIWPPISE